MLCMRFVRNFIFLHQTLKLYIGFNLKFCHACLESTLVEQCPFRISPLLMYLFSIYFYFAFYLINVTMFSCWWVKVILYILYIIDLFVHSEIIFLTKLKTFHVHTIIYVTWLTGMTTWHDYVIWPRDMITWHD